VAFFLIVSSVYILDQWSKYFVLGRMSFFESIPVIENVFHITLIQNFGAAFGIFPYMRDFFIVITLLVVLFILAFLRHVPRGQVFLRLGLALQVAGALGNMTDRVRVGYVIDFLDFRVWPIFNVADMAIVVGVFFLAFDLLRLSQKGQ
jgi:signal peptidase II